MQRSNFNTLFYLEVPRAVRTMFFDTVYIRLLLVTLLYTVSFLSPDCASHVLEKRQVFQRRPRPAFGLSGSHRSSPDKLQVTTTTESPSYYDYEDYYDYYQDQLLTTTTTTTTQPTVPRRKRPLLRGRERLRRPGFRSRPINAKNIRPEFSRNIPQQDLEKFETPTTSTTTLPPTTTKPRRYYPPRDDGRYIDYLSDPNRPRELNGVDLNSYPFFISVPEDINFKCDGRHDGYYSNVLHKCQLFHWCFGGQRYDFLCPNYTLYDQTTFTCRFVNTVDCENSEMHYNRNEDLFVETTTLSREEQREERRKRKRKSKNRRNKNKNRSKKRDEEEDDYEDDDYYEDDNYYEEDDYYEDEKKK
ncbi:uncharacterized protein LOC143231989 [Tachypleus tridentatus]|uniref:uncharacterized protein LOC143231989 n=1 Tax=Tachypleus tridentatus TaxID=6853 RepID=UPI003FD06B3B